MAAPAIAPGSAQAGCGPLFAPVLTQPVSPVPPAVPAAVSGIFDVRGHYRGTFGPVSAYMQVSQHDVQIGPNLPLTFGAPDGTVFPIYGALDTRVLADGVYDLLVVVTTSCGNATTELPLAVDNVDPSISFTGGPANESAIAGGRPIGFSFASAFATTPISFRCSYDDDALTPCTSPTRPRLLKQGRHHFRLVATDTLGNSSTIARTFRIAALPRCRVPHLGGLTLTSARRRLRAAHCALGTVTKPSHRMMRRPASGGRVLVVLRQAAKPGTLLPNGHRVGVRLTPLRHP